MIARYVGAIVAGYWYTGPERRVELNASCGDGGDRGEQHAPTARTIVALAPDPKASTSASLQRSCIALWPTPKGSWSDFHHGVHLESSWTNIHDHTFFASNHRSDMLASPNSDRRRSSTNHPVRCTPKSPKFDLSSVRGRVLAQEDPVCTPEFPKFASVVRSRTCVGARSSRLHFRVNGNQFWHGGR